MDRIVADAADEGLAAIAQRGLDGADAGRRITLREIVLRQGAGRRVMKAQHRLEIVSRAVAVAVDLEQRIAAVLHQHGITVRKRIIAGGEADQRRENIGEVDLVAAWTKRKVHHHVRRRGGSSCERVGVRAIAAGQRIVPAADVLEQVIAVAAGKHAVSRARRDRPELEHIKPGNTGIAKRRRRVHPAAVGRGQ